MAGGGFFRRSDRRARGWRRWLGGLAVVLIGVAGAPEAEAQVRPLTPRGAVTVDQARVAGEVPVPLNKSQLLRVDQAFEEVSVGNPEIADVVPLTQRSVYVFGRSLGTTNLTFIGAQGEPIAVVDLVVSYDVEGLKTRLFELVPEVPIQVRAAGERLVLSGRVPDAGALARVLAVAESFAPEQVSNLLQVGGSQQVLLNVRFAEVERTTVKRLGLNSFFAFQRGATALEFESGAIPPLDPPTFGVGVLNILRGNFELALLFDTLEEKGLVKTLAEPNLIALSGDTASFLAGGEFPIPVGRQEALGGVLITIEFKEFGISLAFTPTVLGDGLMNLVVAAEVSSIDPTVSIQLQDLVIPGLAVRRARTTVELRDGQSFAIAGLLQDDFRNAVRQVPLLGDIPVLGTLFRSTEFQTGQTELVVVITPRLVQPAPAGTLVTPADTFVPPTEPELFLLGRTEGTDLVPRSAGEMLGARGAGGIDGPYGYILR